MGTIKNASEAKQLTDDYTRGKRVEQDKKDLELLLKSIAERAQKGYSAIDTNYLVSENMKSTLEALGFEVELYKFTHYNSDNSFLIKPNNTRISWLCNDIK